MEQCFDGFRVETADDLPAAIAAASSVGAIGETVLLRALHRGLICHWQIARDSSVGQFKRFTGACRGRPTVVVEAADDYQHGSTAAFPAAHRAIGWARFIIVHATGAEPQHYHAAIDATLAVGRVLLVECPATAAAEWVALAAARKDPPSVLLIVPPPDGRHPVLPAGGYAVSAASTSFPVAEIRVGTRHRRDLGDIEPLAQSIADIGLLRPIVMTPAGQLIAGERRLHAYRHLDREQIPVTVVDLDQIVRGEFAENTLRKSFTPSEMADIADALLPIEAAAAKERKAAGRGTGPSGKFPHGVVGNALDHVAKVVGKDRKTITKARAIRDAAKAEPGRFGKLAADMDRTGRVDGPFKRLRVMRQAEAIRAEPPPYPGNGPYRVIVADPPWPYELQKADPSHRARHPYPQRSLADICAQAAKVDAIAHQDCIFWLWTTNHHMRRAFDVLDAWGFEHKQILTWAKDRMVRGDWLRGQTEHCLMAVRGKPIVHLTNQTTLIHGPVRVNSQKPDEFYQLVESLCPAPRFAELFARSARDRWDSHGDEVRNAQALASAQ